MSYEKETKQEEVESEKSETTETVFADRFAGAGVEDIDQHIFFRMAGEKSRENFNELFFVRRIGLHKTIAYIEPVRALGAIQPDPKARTIRSDLIQPLSIFEDAGFDLFEADILRSGEAWKKQRGCQENNPYFSWHPH